MPTYQWQGLSVHGKLLSGSLDAASDTALRAVLTGQQVTLLTHAVQAQRQSRLRQSGRQISPREVSVLTRQLAVMVKAGLPVLRALAALERQGSQGATAQLLGRLRAQLEAGESLASAMRAEPKVFSRLYVAMVTAAEATGDLEHVLAQLARHLERSGEVRRQVQSALLYPAIVVVVATAVTVALLVFVVPVFAELFRGFGQDLPLPTRIVVGVSRLLTDYAIAGIAVLGASAFALGHLYRSNTGRQRIDALGLKLPLLGPALRHSEIAKLTRVLGTVVAAGVPLLESLRIAAAASGNTSYEAALAAVGMQVHQGEPLAQSLAVSGLFPETACQLISVGESTGTLESSLLRIADLYEADVDHLLSRLTALIEPIFIAVLGLVVGGILIAMYLPIFQIGSLVR